MTNWVEYVQMYTVLCMTSNSKALHLNGKAKQVYILVQCKVETDSGLTLLPKLMSISQDSWKAHCLFVEMSLPLH